MTPYFPRNQPAQLVAGRTVTVTWDSRDRNGCILGWVMVDEGIWVNLVMVLTGYAWWFERYAPDKALRRDAQEAARADQRGLWSDAAVIAQLSAGAYTVKVEGIEGATGICLDEVYWVE